MKDRKETGIQKVVNAYKVAKGIDIKDTAWDRYNYARFVRAAKGILEAFNQDYELAMVFVLKTGEEFDEKGLSWNLHTLVSHAWDEKGRRNRATSLQQMGADRVLESRGLNPVASARSGSGKGPGDMLLDSPHWDHPFDADKA